MSSPEHKFQPQIVFAPNNKTGGIPNGPQLESPQRSPLVETSSTTNQYLEALKPHASALLGFTLEPVRVPLASVQSLPSRQSETVDVAQIRAARREHFEQTGEFPRAIGAAEKRQVKTPAERQQEREEQRKALAAEVDLPEHATWEEINAQIDMNKRKVISIEVHMPTAFKRNKMAIESKERSGRDPYPGWESILHHALNLNDGLDFPDEEVAKRIQEARKFFRQQDKERQQK